MKIEITTEQICLIQEEIVKLEAEQKTLDSRDAWGHMFLREEIEKLKGIVESKQIDLSESN